MTPQATPSLACPEAVLDTNVILDWVLFKRATVQPLVDAVLNAKLRWIATEAMCSELEHLLGRPMPMRWENERVRSLSVDFSAWRTIVSNPQAGASGRLICSDKCDQKFIDLALARPARWLVTRDKALLKLARRAKLRGVSVVQPEDWRAD